MQGNKSAKAHCRQP